MNNSAEIIDLRLMKLTAAIDEIFLSENPWAKLQLPTNFELTDTRMIEITKIRKYDTTAIDPFEDFEFRPLVFPQKIHFHLKKGDVFLATMGFKEGIWFITELSPPYEECGWEEFDESP